MYLGQSETLFWLIKHNLKTINLIKLLTWDDQILVSSTQTTESSLIES